MSRMSRMSSKSRNILSIDITKLIATLTPLDLTSKQILAFKRKFETIVGSRVG